MIDFVIANPEVGLIMQRDNKHNKIFSESKKDYVKISILNIKCGVFSFLPKVCIAYGLTGLSYFYLMTLNFSKLYLISYAISSNLGFLFIAPNIFFFILSHQSLFTLLSLLCVDTNIEIWDKLHTKESLDKVECINMYVY